MSTEIYDAREQDEYRPPTCETCLYGHVVPREFAKKPCVFCEESGEYFSPCEGNYIENCYQACGEGA